MLLSIRSKKLVSVALFVLGAVLNPLGLDNEFTFNGCGPGASLCVRVYSLDLSAILIGAITIGVGIRLIRQL